jgi:MFS family permease
MDWIGALIVAVALTMLNIGLGIAETASPNYQNTRWPFLILSVVLLAIYFVWTTKNTTPLLPIHLFQSRNFSIGAALNFLIGIALFIGIANVPLFINTLVATSLEDGAWDSGWLLSGLTVPMAIASIPGGWLTTRVGGRWPVRAGLVIAFAGYLLCTGWQANTSYIQIVSHLALAGIGFGLCMAPAATMMLNESGENERGAASALVMISRLTGMTIGTSAMTTYGIQRMNALSLQFQPTGTNIQNTVMVGMQIAEQVISETFLVAAIICVVAIVPINFSIPSR